MATSRVRPTTGPAAPDADTPSRGPAIPSAHSPLIALVALLACGLLATGAQSGRPALAAAVLVVQLLLGLCWLAVLQASLATAALVGLAALASDVLLLRNERATAGSVAGVLGLAMVAAFAAQLMRRRRRDVTAGLAAAVSGVVLVTAASLALPLRQFPSGREVALTGFVAVAVALVGARLLPGPAIPIRGLSLLVAIVVGARYGATAGDLSAGAALAAAGTAAAFALVLDLGVVRMSRDVGQRQLPALKVVAALLPIVAALPAVYIVGWIVAG
ncbi:MAG TPA: hypothetical protein VLR26_12155 [Frankiaceae bacterium]|nr:hypothetical protein [Frankiaceae bacterium]